MTWRQLRDRLNEATDAVLDRPANASCDPLDRAPEDGFRYMGEIHELNPVGDPQRTVNLVACFDGDPNDQSAGMNNSLVNDAIRAIESLRRIIDHGIPSPSHDGPCGPWAACDGNCESAAYCADDLHHANTTLERLKKEVKSGSVNRVVLARESLHEAMSNAGLISKKRLTKR